MPGRVVGERALVQDPQHAGLEVLPGTRPVGERAVGEADRDRVDGEVPAREVLPQRRAELDVRQRARPGVALAPGAGEIEGDAGRGDRRRPEALVDGQRAAAALRRTPRDGQRVALDDQVELARDLAAQRVADGAADDVHARFPRDGGEHDVGARCRAERVHAVMFH